MGMTRGELLAPWGGLRPCKLKSNADWLLLALRPTQFTE